MNNLIRLGIVYSLSVPLFVYAGESLETQKEVSTLNEMFENAKVSGELRSMYVGYDLKKAGESDIYATAIGGHLKYELAELRGFSAAAAFATSHDIGSATGDNGKQNPELSSSDGEYTVLSQAYLNYRYEDFNFRAGRQLIDTPLADSDDIRMIANTFEAYIATYEAANFSFMAGKLQKWQGYDADLDNGWVKTAQDGTWFGGIGYADKTIEANAWYYNITKLTNASYFDIALNHELDDEISASVGFQYLNESELSSSGVEADIYGVFIEGSAYGFTLGAAYNRSSKNSNKSSFSGFGGGALYTSMDVMILDEITEDRDAEAMTGSISYGIDKLTFVYAYGDFKGDADGAAQKAHIIEQNIGVEYIIEEEMLSARLIYVDHQDKESSIKTDDDWERLELALSYSF